MAVMKNSKILKEQTKYARSICESCSLDISPFGKSHLQMISTTRRSCSINCKRKSSSLNEESSVARFSHSFFSRIQIGGAVAIIYNKIDGENLKIDNKCGT